MEWPELFMTSVACLCPPLYDKLARISRCYWSSSTAESPTTTSINKVCRHLESRNGAPTHWGEPMFTQQITDCQGSSPIITQELVWIFYRWREDDNLQLYMNIFSFHTVGCSNYHCDGSFMITSQAVVHFLFSTWYLQFTGRLEWPWLRDTAREQLTLTTAKTAE